jgi:hypothetical protein
VFRQADVPLKRSGIHWIGNDLVLTVTGSSILRMVLQPADVTVLKAELAKIDGQTDGIATSGPGASINVKD